MTLLDSGHDAKDRDFKVEKLSDERFLVTDMASGTSQGIEISNFDYEHNSLIKMDEKGGKNSTFQLLNVANDIKFDFYYAGGKVETLVYDETQYKYKKHMAPPVKVDQTKQIISPMPGAMISVSVEPGQTVVDGQELCVIEAMKMQNIIKSEKAGKIKSVKVKAGDSVTVDQLLIEFE